MKQHLILISSLMALVVSGSLPAIVHADVPNTFVAGEAAVAADVNNNFIYLDERIDALEASVSSIDGAVSNDWVSYDYIPSVKGEIVNIPELQYTYITEGKEITSFPNEVHSTLEEFNAYSDTWDEEHTVSSDEFIVQEGFLTSEETQKKYIFRVPRERFGYNGTETTDDAFTVPYFTPFVNSAIQQSFTNGDIELMVRRNIEVNENEEITFRYTATFFLFGLFMNGIDLNAKSQGEMDALVDHTYFGEEDL